MPYNTNKHMYIELNAQIGQKAVSATLRYALPVIYATRIIMYC